MAVDLITTANSASTENRCLGVYVLDETRAREPAATAAIRLATAVGGRSTVHDQP